MLTSFGNISSRLFQFKSMFGIVYGYQPKRSLFDKTNYIENFIPRPTPYARSRKPRLQQWDDPSVAWPSIYPPITTLKGRNLIKQVEQEETNKIVAFRNFTIPDFRTGDIVQFKWVHNISDPNINTYTGLVLCRRNKNSLHSSFKVIFKYCGVEVFMHAKLNSPYLRDFKILKRGSGNIRSKIAIWGRNTRSLTAPITNRQMKKRAEDFRSKRSGQKGRKVKLQDAKDPLLNKK